MPRVFKDYYQILGVSPQADLKTIRTAYRKLARKHHPDLNPSPEATRMMQDINEAYQVLSDPDQRRMYDMWAAHVRSGQSYPVGSPRRNAEAEYWRRATEEYQRQAAARRAAEEQARREQARAEERRRKTAEQRAKEQAEATLRRIEEERRKREAAEAEEEAREQHQREQAETILRRIEAERLKRERAEAAQEDAGEQRRKEEAEAVLREIEEKQRRRKEARARQEAAAHKERERAQESLRRIEAERLRRERAEAAQNDERRQKEEAEAVIRRIDAQRRRREAAEAEQEAREEWQYEQAVAILRRIDEERLKRGGDETAQDDAEEQRQKEEAEAVLREIEEERRRRKEAIARQEAAERSERKRAQDILDQIERERFRREAARRSQAAKSGQAAAGPLWTLIMRLPWQVTAMAGLAALVGIMSLSGIGASANQAAKAPSTTLYPNVCDYSNYGNRDTPTPSPYTVLYHPQDRCASSKDIKWSPDGSMLAVAFDGHKGDDIQGGDQYDVVIWDARSYELRQTLSGHIPPIAWSPDGKKLASYTRDAEVTVWNIPDGVEVARIGGIFAEDWPNKVTDLAWSPDGSTLDIVQGGEVKSIRLWHYELNNPVHNDRGIQIAKPGSSWYSVDWSPDGSTIAMGWRRVDSSGRGGILLLDRKTGEVLQTLDYDDAPLPVRWSPNGYTIAGALGPEVVLMDTLKPGEPFQILNPDPQANPHTESVANIAWSPDGNFLAVRDSYHVEVLDVLGCQSEFCKSVQFLTSSNYFAISPTYAPRLIAWSPDGKRLAVGLAHEGVTIWEPQIASE